MGVWIILYIRSLVYRLSGIRHLASSISPLKPLMCANFRQIQSILLIFNFLTKEKI